MDQSPQAANVTTWKAVRFYPFLTYIMSRMITVVFCSPEYHKPRYSEKTNHLVVVRHQLWWWMKVLNVMLLKRQHLGCAGLSAALNSVFFSQRLKNANDTAKPWFRFLRFLMYLVNGNALRTTMKVILLAGLYIPNAHGPFTLTYSWIFQCLYVWNSAVSLPLFNLFSLYALCFRLELLECLLYEQ